MPVLIFSNHILHEISLNINHFAFILRYRCNKNLKPTMHIVSKIYFYMLSAVTATSL